MPSSQLRPHVSLFYSELTMRARREDKEKSGDWIRPVPLKQTNTGESYVMQGYGDYDEDNTMGSRRESCASSQYAISLAGTTNIAPNSLFVHGSKMSASSTNIHSNPSELKTAVAMGICLQEEINRRLQETEENQTWKSLLSSEELQLDEIAGRTHGREQEIDAWSRVALQGSELIKRLKYTWYADCISDVLMLQKDEFTTRLKAYRVELRARTSFFLSYEESQRHLIETEQVELKRAIVEKAESKVRSGMKTSEDNSFAAIRLSFEMTFTLLIGTVQRNEKAPSDDGARRDSQGATTTATTTTTTRVTSGSGGAQGSQSPKSGSHNQPLRVPINERDAGESFNDSLWGGMSHDDEHSRDEGAGESSVSQTTLYPAPPHYHHPHHHVSNETVSHGSSLNSQHNVPTSSPRYHLYNSTRSSGDGTTSTTVLREISTQTMETSFPQFEEQEPFAFPSYYYQNSPSRNGTTHEIAPESNDYCYDNQQYMMSSDLFAYSSSRSNLRDSQGRGGGAYRSSSPKRQHSGSAKGPLTEGDTNEGSIRHEVQLQPDVPSTPKTPGGRNTHRPMTQDRTPSTVTKKTPPQHNGHGHYYSSLSSHQHSNGVHSNNGSTSASKVAPSPPTSARPHNNSRGTPTTPSSTRGGNAGPQQLHTPQGGTTTSSPRQPSSRQRSIMQPSSPSSNGNSTSNRPPSATTRRNYGTPSSRQGTRNNSSGNGRHPNTSETKNSFDQLEDPEMLDLYAMVLSTMNGSTNNTPSSKSSALPLVLSRMREPQLQNGYGEMPGGATSQNGGGGSSARKKSTRPAQSGSLRNVSASSKRRGEYSHGGGGHGGGAGAPASPIARPHGPMFNMPDLDFVV